MAASDLTKQQELTHNAPIPAATMWGALLMFYLFFQINDSLNKWQRATGSYIVLVATQFFFAWIAVVLHQEEITGTCKISGELFDWVSMSLVFASIVWITMLVLSMRYGTAQDFELHREWVFDLEFPGQSKLREDGLSNKFSVVPMLQRPATITDSEYGQRLEALEKLAEEKRALAVPCRRTMHSNFLIRLAIVYFLMDTVWGVYGVILAFSTLGTNCADEVPKVVTLTSAISAVFAVAFLFIVFAVLYNTFKSHIYFGVGRAGAVPKKKIQGALSARRGRGVGPGVGAGVGAGIGSDGDAGTEL